MKTENAAGRKTDRFERAAQRLEEQMETQLELLTGAMRGSVTRADAVTDQDDEYGHRRDSHIGQAVKIGAVSAQIVVALGKYAGEFNHNINVKRTSEDKASGKDDPEAPRQDWLKHALSGKRLPPDVELPPYELPRSSSHPPLDRLLKEYHAERDAELAAEAAAAANEGAGVPPTENSGSNG